MPGNTSPDKALAKLQQWLAHPGNRTTLLERPERALAEYADLPVRRFSNAQTEKAAGYVRSPSTVCMDSLGCQGVSSIISPPRWPRHADGCAKRGAAHSGLWASRATKQTPHAGASPEGKAVARRIAALPFACAAGLRGTQGALHCTAPQAFAGAK